jgi:hypothetical protein
MNFQSRNGERTKTRNSFVLTSFRAFVIHPVVVVAVTAGAAAAPPLVWTDLPRADANLVSIDAQGQVVFDIDGRKTARPAADLVRWGHLKPPPADKPAILLAGDGLLIGEPTKLADGKLHVVSALAGEVLVPRAALRAILWHGASDISRWERLLDSAKRPPDTDRLILTNGDELTGRAVSLSTEHLTWRGSAGELRLEIDRIAAVGLFPPASGRSAISSSLGSAGGRTASEAPPRSRQQKIIGLTDGSRLTADSIVVAADTASLELPHDIQLRLPANQVAMVQPLGGRATYLSDLAPQSYRHVPFFDIPWNYRRDRSAGGRWLESAGERYAKGLGMHSASRLGYVLDRPYKRFEAEIAIDDSAAPHGSVIFRVLTDDGDGRWNSRYTSPTVRSGQRPIPISVDLSGAKRLSLLVDYADFGDLSDHANWLDARLIE